MPVVEWKGPPPFGGKATVVIGVRKPPKGLPKSDSPPEPENWSATPTTATTFVITTEETERERLPCADAPQKEI